MPSKSALPPKNISAKILSLGDIAGTFVFALEGASLGARHHLDLLGLVVIAFVTGLGGGIIRDVLIGDVPPPGIHDWRYGVTAFVAAVTVLFTFRMGSIIPESSLVYLDAAGLALFAVTGAAKALRCGISVFMAALMGTVTGVGGGVIRDVLLSSVPHILQSDIYALAAFAGACVVVVGHRAKLRPDACAVVGGLVCFGLRMISYHNHWNLPTP